MTRFLIAIPAMALVICALGCGQPEHRASGTATTATSATVAPTAEASAVPTIDTLATAGVATAGPASTVASDVTAGAQPTSVPAPEPTPFPTVAQTGETGIAGYVTLGPMCPVQRADIPCPDQPYAARLTVWQGARMVAETTSGSDGSFQVLIAPGTYRIVGESTGTLPHGSEQAVEVREGILTNVLITFDTGIR